MCGFITIKHKNEQLVMKIMSVAPLVSSALCFVCVWCCVISNTCSAELQLRKL